MLRYQDQKIEMAGIIFNDMRRSNTQPEQVKSCHEVKAIAKNHGWPMFENPHTIRIPTRLVPEKEHRFSIDLHPLITV